MPSDTTFKWPQTVAFHQCKTAGPHHLTPANLLGLFPCPASLLCTLSTDLQVVLKIIHQEGHVISQAPLDCISLVGLEVLALHLQGPAVLQLSLDPAHAQ